MRKVLALLMVPAVMAAATSACGSSGGTASAAGAPAAASAAASAGARHVVEIDVAPTGLAYQSTTASVPAGPVVLRSKNPQAISHNISLRGNGISLQGKLVANGAYSQVVVSDLKPGTYTFYCSVPGHEQAGMKGTLTVH